MISKNNSNIEANTIIFTDNELLPTFIKVARKMHGIEVEFLHKNGAYELHAKRAGNKCPARCRVQLINPKAVLSSPNELADVFGILIDQILAYAGSEIRDVWVPIPGQGPVAH
jgi:hypothetical protein